jgi:hypothetical protein
LVSQEITVRNKVPGENILVGFLFRTVFSKGTHGNLFIARISTESLFCSKYSSIKYGSPERTVLYKYPNENIQNEPYFTVITKET